ncbi:MAG TPA: DUF433 domain-containing protein [Ktedonobacterales bacterium]|jgi:uncharacterized protein (DUF433 family)
MSNSDDAYVELRERVRYARGSRVPLESLIWLWREGQSAEAIREAYPTLRLAEVYGALAWYLDHQDEVDQEMADGLAQFEAQRSATEAANPTRYATLRQRFAAARAHQSAS